MSKIEDICETSRHKGVSSVSGSSSFPYLHVDLERWGQDRKKTLLSMLTVNQILGFVWQRKESSCRKDKKSVSDTSQSYNPYSLMAALYIPSCCVVSSSSSPLWLVPSKEVERLEKEKQIFNIQLLLYIFNAGVADGVLQSAFNSELYYPVTTATKLIWALDYCSSLKEASLWIPGLWAHSSDLRAQFMNISDFSHQFQ